MTTAVLSQRRLVDRRAAPGPLERPAARIAVEVLACGSIDRGDDGAALIALERLGSDLGEDVAVRTVGQLDLHDLLAVAPGAGVVVADTALGIAPGWIVEIPLAGLDGRGSGVQARSSHALSIPDTIRLARVLRGEALDGILVAIGGSCFGLGEAPSWPVTAAIPAFALAIEDAVRRVRRCSAGARSA